MPLITPGSGFDPSINTYTGRLFFYNKIDSESLELRSIAHALGNTCRFTGHCRRFYSVAEHSLLVAQYLRDTIGPNVSLSLIRSALMHDASEAFVGDVNSPLKAMIAPLFKPIEKAILDAIDEKWGLFTRDPRIKHADTVLYLCERETIMAPLPPEHPEHGYIPLTDEVRNHTLPWFRERVKCWNPKYAGRKFLNTAKLCGL